MLDPPVDTPMKYILCMVESCQYVRMGRRVGTRSGLNQQLGSPNSGPGQEAPRVLDEEPLHFWVEPVLAKKSDERSREMS